MNKYQHRKPSRLMAVDYAETVLRTAADWQDAQHALADHPTLGPFLRGTYGPDVLGEVQSIIREAEERIGDELPY